MFRLRMSHQNQSWRHLFDGEMPSTNSDVRTHSEVNHLSEDLHNFEDDVAKPVSSSGRHCLEGQPHGAGHGGVGGVVGSLENIVPRYKRALPY